MKEGPCFFPKNLCASRGMPHPLLSILLPPFSNNYATWDLETMQPETLNSQTIQPPDYIQGIRIVPLCSSIPNASLPLDYTATRRVHSRLFGFFWKKNRRDLLVLHPQNQSRTPPLFEPRFEYEIHERKPFEPHSNLQQSSLPLPTFDHFSPSAEARQAAIGDTSLQRHYSPFTIPCSPLSILYSLPQIG